MGQGLTWKIQLEGRTWEAPLPAALMIQIGDMAGVEDWTVIDPLASPKVLCSYLSVLLGDAMGVTPEVASTQVLGRSLDELMACVVEYGTGG